MTDHHDELRVAPDPSRAEELRQRLHERLASGSADEPVATSRDGGLVSMPTGDAGPDDRGADLITLETENRRREDRSVVPRRRSSGRWLLAAAAAVVIAVVGTVLVASSGEDDDEIDTATEIPAAESPFVGAWRSTDASGSSRTMYIDQWDIETYLVRVSDEAGTVCSGVGQPTSETSLLVTGRPLPIITAGVSCDDGAGSFPPPGTEVVFTLDPASPDQLVDSSGVVWREQAAPPPDAEHAALLQAFLEARVAGEGAEQYVEAEPGMLRDESMPLLYATTSGAVYERFEIERAQDPDGGATYIIRLFTEAGTVVQQGFGVFDGYGDQDGLLVVAYVGPTLEDGHAVLLPFGILDGVVRVGVSSSWDVEWYDGEVGAFQHRFVSDSTGSTPAIVIAAEPVGVGRSCETRPAPANARALAQSIIAGSGHEVSEPVPVRIAGIDGLQLDVTVTDGRTEFLCTFEGSGTLRGVQSGGGRFRLFLLDIARPSAGVLTIAVMSTPDAFEDAIAEIAPILDSVQVDPG